ncbi:hypothetical protein EDB80DRAFT_251516 [Ilyonectria destructans]|nr:hypothetical protein EDB80DRAFT_251516 [Ilyonectria destructans]
MENHQHPPQQACDSCRFRKTKCDRGIPCAACTAASIRCQYAQTLRRRGPRGGKGRRLAQLRQGNTQLDKDAFDVSTPTTFSRFNDGSRSNSNKAKGGSGNSDEGQPTPPAEDHSISCPSWSKSPGRISPQPKAYLSLPSSNDPTMDSVGNTPQLYSTLAAHVQAFVKYVFPIMPVVNTDEILVDVFRLDELPPSRYALIMSLCATTRQLNLERMEDHDDDLGVDIPPDPKLTFEMLLALAENACRQFHLVEDISLDTVVTSYFLFTIYASLEKFQHAWFYLNQSITLAISLSLDYDASYVNLSDSDRELGRRVFWILFVTERTFALQHRRPVRLRNCIAKPDIVNSACPVVMNDLYNHIGIFEALPPSLYEWHPQSDADQPRGVALADEINTKLCVVQAADSMIESQRFDTLITQQWLRVALWRLVFGENPSPSHNSSALLPFSIPIDVGRTIMETLHSVRQSSIDCHGIAIEQKLCDIGISLADSALALSSGFSSFEIGPRDLLCAVVESLFKTRGGQSQQLPKLLKHSEYVLGYDDPAAHIDLGWPLYNEPTESDEQPMDSPSRLIEDLTNDTSWLLTDDLGFGDLDSF